MVQNGKTITETKKRISKPWRIEEVELLRTIFTNAGNDALLAAFEARTLKAIKNKARELGLQKPPSRIRLEPNEPLTLKAPKFTICDICNTPLNEEDISMGAANHRDCWRDWVEDQRRKNPLPDEQSDRESGNKR